MSSIFGWDYPPGVTGNEFEIAGPSYEKESEKLCPDCGGPTMEVGYGDLVGGAMSRWLACIQFEHTTDLEPLEDDPDRKYDERY